MGSGPELPAVPRVWEEEAERQASQASIGDRTRRFYTHWLATPERLFLSNRRPGCQPQGLADGHSLKLEANRQGSRRLTSTACSHGHE